MADGTEQEVEKIRDHVAEELGVTKDERKKTHPKRGQNVYVNHVAFALAYLIMGKAIVKKRKGVYQIADHGRKILERGVDLTIKELRDA